MDTPYTNAQGVLVRNELDLIRILEHIPQEHRGLGFERAVLVGLHPQENTRMLELAFALVWAEYNTGCKYQLESMMRGREDDPRIHAAPRTDREWEVASLVAASIIRWLPTSVGCCFLQEAFRRGGGSMGYELPDPMKGMPLPDPL